MSEIDTLIQKYLQGITSEEENHQLQQWILLSPENKKRLFAEKDVWETFGYHSSTKEYDISAELEVIRNRISFQSSTSSYLKRILQVAAVLLLTFGLGWSSQYLFRNNQQSAEATMQEIFVPKGQVNQVFLADGTRIWINSESRLITPSVFASDERVVKLNGEAFFEVSKDKKRPFKVEVNGQQIEVLGTSFNVRAYDSSNEIETTLETGQIRLQSGNQTTFLKPGEQSFFNKSNKQLIVSKVDPVIFSSWKSGRFEFQNEDLTEVFKVIERWYDVDIDIDQASIAGMHFSGVIKRNKDARHFLELLNYSIPINYRINLDKIQITLK